ncbi:Fungal specific transcription factor domain-containing protein 65 [Elsinoe fawcettii]|nr:Fungal specific transcription factor domain-containing protein 65 [Elsinoe fawcettii]
MQRKQRASVRRSDRPLATEQSSQPRPRHTPSPASRLIATVPINPVGGDDSRNVDALAAAVDDETNDANASEAMVYNAGNAHGAVSFVAALVNEDGQHRSHYPVRPYSRKTKSPEDLEYLRVKGVFDLPNKEACDALIRTYFMHVHPLLPILDAKTFLDHFERHGHTNVNLLLLWSMVVGAAQFEEEHVLHEAGMADRKALKRMAFERAKLLYDMAYDEDPIVLIQAVILIAHWHTDAEDRFETWHWLGIAISLCQTSGLHYTPSEAAMRLPQFTESRKRLYRRIWWTCVYRDRWLATVKGRPLRIQISDGDLAPAEAEDVAYDVRRLSVTQHEKYFPYDTLRTSQAWERLVQISVMLGKIIVRNIAGQQTDPTGIQSLTEGELYGFDWPTDEETEDIHPFERACHLHTRLLQQATRIAFWRPCLSNYENRNGVLQASWITHASECARTAATRANVVLERICARDLLRYMKPQAISAMVPVMQMHLLDCKSAISSVRVLGTTRLQLCMNIMMELEKTYTAAGFALKLFEKAHEKLLSRSRGRAAARLSTGDPDVSNHPVAHQSVLDGSYQDTNIGLTPGQMSITSSDINIDNWDIAQNFWSNMTTADESLFNDFLALDQQQPPGATV